MLIHKENYEAYMLDYLEGSLSPEYRAEMEVFLLAHPELKEELLALDELHLPEEEALSFDHKALLKADPRSEDLPALERWLEEHKELRLPHEEICYPHKQALKRKTSFTFRKSYYYWAAAASLALLLTALWVIKPAASEDAPSSRFAQELPKETIDSPKKEILPLAEDKTTEAIPHKTPKQHTLETLVPSPKSLPDNNIALLPTEEKTTGKMQEEKTSSTLSIASLKGLTAFALETPQSIDLLPARPFPAERKPEKDFQHTDYLLAADEFLDKIENEISSRGRQRAARIQNRLLTACNETAYTLRRKSIIRRIELDHKIQEISLKKNMTQKP